MSCDQFRDDYELYALGALESAEAGALREHLAHGCEFCNSEVRRALAQSEMILHTVPLVDPPTRLRRRIESTFVPRRTSRPAILPWFVAAAAMLALVIGLTVENRARRTDLQIAQSNSAELARLSHIVQILQAPSTVEVSFGPGKTGPHGSLFVNPGSGIALVVRGLPAPPAGSNYYSWVVPKNGPPRPVAPFKTDNRGSAVTVVPGPVNVAGITAVAVSLEPENSHPVTPTTVVFAAHV